VLFRVALSILKLNEPDVLGAEGVGDLFAVVGGMTSRLWSADKLITVRSARRELGGVRLARRSSLTRRCNMGTRRSCGTKTSRAGSSGTCATCKRRKVAEQAHPNKSNKLYHLYSYRMQRRMDLLWSMLVLWAERAD